MLLDYDCQLPDFDTAERERDFPLYVNVLKSAMKFIFVFKHYNYKRWINLHEDDLMKLQVVPPQIYPELFLRNFVVQKTLHQLSPIALNRAHEQNSKIIKGVDAAIGFLSPDLDAGFKWWAVAPS